MERLRDRLDVEIVVRRLMPAQFTLSELQATCEAIAGKPLDKRNFRKKLKALDVVEPTGAVREGSAHRPAALFRATKPDD